jgi:hypothetical protein
MKLYQHEGYKRLSILIAIVGFICTYILLINNETGYVSAVLAFIGFPIISAIVAAGIYIFTRTVYWVIDGFRKQEDSLSEGLKGLIRRGKEKGFLTYDEINDLLPPSIITSDQIDEIIELFRNKNIDIIDTDKGKKRDEK